MLWDGVVYCHEVSMRSKDLETKFECVEYWSRDGTLSSKVGMYTHMVVNAPAAGCCTRVVAFWPLPDVPISSESMKVESAVRRPK